MESLGYAYDSAGASEEQFQDTMDSLETKLNNLKNAWDTFITGITNSQVIKAAVDLLTQLLNIVNKVTGSLGDIGTAVSRIALLFTSLYGVGGKLIKWFQSGLTGILKNAIGKDVKKDIVDEVKDTASEAGE
jgi:chemotaxis regulatin CheY-phosphate phosphatase CheZ